MAKIYPSHFPRINDDRRWAENRVFEACKGLDDDWIVFYSVAWQSLRYGRQGDGEADFVLAHQRYGVFTVEVKGGSEVFVEDGQWFSRSKNGTHRLNGSPFIQAVDSKYALRKFLAEHVTAFSDSEHMGHFVVFPSHEQQVDMSPEGPRDIICDEIDLENFADRVLEIAKHWGLNARFSNVQMEEIKSALAPTIQAKRVLHRRVRDIKSEILDLTDAQIRYLGMLRKVRKFIVKGSAGTGKTVLALARARQLESEGFKTLLICYNRLLGERLKAEVEGSTIVAGSFHQVCFDFATRANCLPGGKQNQQWWDDDLPSVLGDAAILCNISFDAIVIDEAQDMNPEWWDYLEELYASPKDAIMSVFADSNQDIYRQDWLPPFDGVESPLDVNCRNTQEIAKRVIAAMPEAAPASGASGVEPTFKVARTDVQVVKAVKASLGNFITEGKLEPSQVRVLATRRTDVEIIESGLRENQGSDWSNILVETVHRFKGMEADAVVLVLREEDEIEHR